MHIELVCVYFEFTLLSSTWLTKIGLKSAHREHENYMKTPWHQFAGMDISLWDI